MNTRRVQLHFIPLLAKGAGPAEAARTVGRSRRTAYALRDRPGAQEFAAAWDAAVRFASDARIARRVQGPDLTQCGIETILVPRFYRGRLVGFVQRGDHYRALRALKQIDRAAERMDPSVNDPAIYDDLLESLERKPAETD